MQSLSLVLLDNVAGLCRVMTVLRRHGVEVEMAEFVQATAGGVLTLQTGDFSTGPELVVRHLERLPSVVSVACLPHKKPAARSKRRPENGQGGDQT